MSREYPITLAPLAPFRGDQGPGGPGVRGGSLCKLETRFAAFPRALPPHPQPFSPAKPGEKGARVSVEPRSAQVTQASMPDGFSSPPGYGIACLRQAAGCCGWLSRNRLDQLHLEQRSAVASGVAQFLFDPQQLIVLGHAVGSRGGTGLDLAGARAPRPGRRWWRLRSRRCGGWSRWCSRCVGPAESRRSSRSASRSG